MGEKIARTVLRVGKLRALLIAASVTVLVYCIIQIAGYYVASAQSEQAYDRIGELYHSDEDLQAIAEPSSSSTPSPSPPPTPIAPALPVALPDPSPTPGLEAALQLKPIQPERAVRFAELAKSNPDVVGWLHIPDTKLDYPVVQTEDNAYYLSHGFDQRESIAGAIFMDYRNEYDKPAPNTILYGHHMKNGSMFGSLIKYRDESHFKANRIITFDTLHYEMRWEIFSVYVTDTSFDYIRTEFNDDASYIRFLEQIQSKSIYPTEVQLNASDRILTLSTCEYDFDSARLVIHAKLIIDTSD